MRRNEPLDDDRGEAERELVDEHEARPRDERLREHDHLLLAARERARGEAPAPLQLGEQLERVRDAAPRVLPAQRVGRDAQVLLDGEVREELTPLGDDRDTRGADLLGTPAGELDVTERDRAGGGAEDAADRQHERRLSGAVRSEQCRDLARRDRDRHVTQHLAPASCDGQP